MNLLKENNKLDIRKLSLEEIQEKVVALGLQRFRGQQIYEWLWKKSAVSFDEMTNLSKNFRATLKTHFIINNIKIYKEQISTDGTIKSAFKLHDDHLIEGVLIPTEDRATACVSSQVGCSLSCKFCATGYMPRIRNLDFAEIYDQVVLINRQALKHLGRPLSNIVFMGMGEPLLNYNQVIAAIKKINAEEGLHISNKRITVSTAGIAKMIKKLGDDDVKFNLALSLHAADDVKRSKIMPINDQNNLAVLIDALNYFYSKTKGQITFEYILLQGVNDSLEDAKKLADLCLKVPAKINVIEYNAIQDAAFTKTGVSDRQKFMTYLDKRRVNATLRVSRGKDIDAACGQLANK